MLVARNFSVKIKQITKDRLMFVCGVKNYILFEQILNFMRCVKIVPPYNIIKKTIIWWPIKLWKCSVMCSFSIFCNMQKVKYLYHWFCYTIAVGYNNASVYELNCFVSMLPIIILFISGQRYSKHVFSEASHIISEPHTVWDFSYSLASLKWCTP